MRGGEPRHGRPGPGVPELNPAPPDPHPKPVSKCGPPDPPPVHNRGPQREPGPPITARPAQAAVAPDRKPEVSQYRRQ
eukprot:1185266-Prorocentrum_minimum.AAC.3